MSASFQENYSRRLAAHEVDMQREIAEDRRKIAQRQRRQALLETWIEQRIHRV